MLQELQRAIQIRNNTDLVGMIEEAMVEGYNQATGQWIGRTTQNRPLNFTHRTLAAPNGQTLVGSFLPVRVTRAGPNSLAGEAVL